MTDLLLAAPLASAQVAFPGFVARGACVVRVTGERFAESQILVVR